MGNIAFRQVHSRQYTRARSGTCVWLLLAAFSLLLLSTSSLNAATLTAQSAAGAAGTSVDVNILMGLTSSEYANQAGFTLQVTPVANGATALTTAPSLISHIAGNDPTTSNPTTNSINVNWTSGKKFNLVSGAPSGISVVLATIRISVPTNAPPGALYALDLTSGGVRYADPVAPQNWPTTLTDGNLQVPGRLLTLHRTGNGAVTVDGTVVTFVDSTFTKFYVPGSSVTLGATPDADYRWRYWQENTTQTTTNPLTITLNVNRTITAVFAANTPPVLASIGNQTTAEGSELTFTVSATDADGDSLGYSASNLPSGATFNPATRVFSWTPDYSQSGTYPNVRFTVNDGTASDLEDISISVSNTNRPPVLDPIGNQTVAENSPLIMTLNATDPDGDSLTYSVTPLPSGATIDPNTGGLSWTPDYDQAGPYSVTFAVSDGTANDSEEILITVTNSDRPPVLDPIGNKTVDEGSTLSFTVTGSDPDGDSIVLSATDLPSGAVFTPGTGNFSWTPDSTQSGNYPVTFTATAGGLSDSETITISVGDVQHPPELAPIGDKNVDEGALLSFTLSAIDPDGDDLTYSASNLPSGASFNAASRTFTWTPTYSQAGTYPAVHFEVTDGLLTDSEDITITVSNVNRAPILGSIGNQTVAEGSLLSFVISATDPDGDSLTYSASNLPSGATFDPATRSFSWTPGYTQSGTYPNVRFEVSDGSAVDYELITIDVSNTNRAPVLAPIGDKDAVVGSLLTFTVSATDADGDSLTYSASNLPAGATFNAATRIFSWTPADGQEGSYPAVHFEVSDGTSTDSEDITITVAPKPLTYMVGDTNPEGIDLNGDGDSYDVGEFGNDLLTWDDVADAIIKWCESILPPPSDSDEFDAMDSYPIDTTAKRGGDGIISWGDIITTYDRSMATAPIIPYRTPLTAPITVGDPATGGPVFQLSSTTGTPGTSVLVPVVVQLGTKKADRLGFGVQLSTLSGANSAAITGFTPATGIATPQVFAPSSDMSAVIWLTPMARKTGTITLGYLQVAIPVAALPSDVWKLHLTSVGASLTTTEITGTVAGPDALVGVTSILPHDVSVTWFTLTTQARVGDTLNLVATVHNNTTTPETVVVNLSREGIQLDSHTVSIPGSGSIDIHFTGYLVIPDDRPRVTFTAQAVIPVDDNLANNAVSQTIRVRNALR